MWRVNLNLDKAKRAAKTAPQHLQAKTPELLESLGVQLLSFAKLDYVAKGRGQTGSDGITWESLKPETIERKNRKGAGGKRSKRRARARTRSGKARPGVGKSQIGVDSGLQLNSMAPGFRGGDGRGGNFFRILGSQVTVGANRSYSVHFDRRRPIFPETLPASWGPPLEKIIDKWANRILIDAMKDV